MKETVQLIAFVIMYFVVWSTFMFAFGYSMGQANRKRYKVFCDGSIQPPEGTD